MSRRGRPERPINAAGGPLLRLAGELRRLREGRPYRDLAAETGLSASTLQAAAAGKRLPSWQVTDDFALACGGENTISQIRKLWVEACTAAGRPVPNDDPSEELPVPDPEAISDGAQFIEWMKLLRARAGNPSLAELNRRSGGFGLPPSTVSEMLHKQKLPPLDRVQKYVRACGLNDDQVHAWEVAWKRISEREKHEQLTNAGNHGQERQHRGSSAALRDFLKWLSGTPAEVLSRTPAERSGYAGLGGAMLLTSMASALAAAWAVHVVLTPKWLAAGAAGMVWGVAIASLDRMVVTSIRRGHRRRNLFVIIPHVVLSVLLALLIATPIALRIFAPEINAQIVTTQSTVLESSLNSINAEYSPLIQRLQSELATSQMRAAAARSQADCKLSGGSGCHPGQGPAYAAALKAYQSAEAEVASLQGQISNLHSQQAAAQKNIITAENQNQEGLLSNLAALNRITDHNKTIAIVRWLLFGAFTLLGCVPAIVKTLKVLEPQNADEKETLAQEDVRVPASL